MSMHSKLRPVNWAPPVAENPNDFIRGKTLEVHPLSLSLVLRAVKGIEAGGTPDQGKDKLW